MTRSTAVPHEASQGPSPGDRTSDGPVTHPFPMRPHRVLLQRTGPQMGQSLIHTPRGLTGSFFRGRDLRWASHSSIRLSTHLSNHHPSLHPSESFPEASPGAQPACSSQLLIQASQAQHSQGQSQTWKVPASPREEGGCGHRAPHALPSLPPVLGRDAEGNAGAGGGTDRPAWGGQLPP